MGWPTSEYSMAGVKSELKSLYQGLLVHSIIFPSRFGRIDIVCDYAFGEVGRDLGTPKHPTETASLRSYFPDRDRRTILLLSTIE